MVEQLEIGLGDLIHIVVSGLGVQDLGHPLHTQDALDAWREAHPVVGAEGHLVILAVLDGRYGLPVLVIGHGAVNAAGGEEHDRGVPVQDLLHVHLVAGTLGGGLVHHSQIIAQHIDDLGVIGVPGDDVQALFTGDIQDIGLLHAVHDGLDGVIGIAAVVGQGLTLVGHSQQVAEHGIGIVHGGQVGVNVDKGDSGLFLQAVQILRHGALGLAHIDDHVGIGRQQRLQVQFALAAVQLAQQGQVQILLVKVILGGLVPGIGHTHHLVRGDGKDHHLGQRAGDGHLLDIGGDGDLAAAGVGKHAGGVLRPGAVVDLVVLGLPAAGKQGQAHHQRQGQRQQSFCLVHMCSPSSVENAIIPKRRTPGSCHGKSGSPVEISLARRSSSAGAPPP